MSKNNEPYWYHDGMGQYYSYMNRPQSAISPRDGEMAFEESRRQAFRAFYNREKEEAPQQIQENKASEPIKK